MVNNLIDKPPVARSGGEPPEEKHLGRLILKVKRQFYIQQKAIFEAAIIAYANHLPEPVPGPQVKSGEAMTTWENSLILMRIRDKFMGFCAFKLALWNAFWKILIVKSDYDPIYQSAGQFILEELVEAILGGEWKPRPQNEPPSSMWREPKPYGNLIGRGFKEYIKGK